MCLRLKKHLTGTFEKRGYIWESLQADWVGRATGLTRNELMAEMKVLTAESEIIGGVDAWIYLARTVWWMYPLYVLGKVKWIYPGLDLFYRGLVARRYCIGGS